jgi:hypothetical protein
MYITGSACQKHIIEACPSEWHVTLRHSIKNIDDEHMLLSQATHYFAHDTNNLRLIVYEITHTGTIPLFRWRMLLPCWSIPTKVNPMPFEMRLQIRIGLY